MSGHAKETSLDAAVEDSLCLAEARCKATGERLTPARREAYAVMLEQNKPLSAYELIAVLEEKKGKKIAPLTVYRHLDFLTRVGLVHRLESTHSFVACVHPDHAHESHYLLCSECGSADEVESTALGSLLDEIADRRGFRPENAIVEIKGVCGDCASDAEE
ncbi:MAG: Fur family transcriptional regulator [Woeseiaceae bacterium]|nr:Fur family transcriptional regulator [Woeseiaceae bacterium]